MTIKPMVLNAPAPVLLGSCFSEQPVHMRMVS